MKHSCLIIDDERFARELLEEYIGMTPVLELCGSARGAMEGLDLIREHSPDIIFLDIQMPDLTGIELLKTLEKPPVVIITTAYKEYALEGYDLDVADYLLKPFTFERFLKAVNRASKRVENRGRPDEGNQAKDLFSFKADGAWYRIPYSDILYIEGLKEYIIIHTETKRYLVLERMHHLEQRLPGEMFLRVHKSFIINTGKATSLYGNTLMIEDREIPVGRTYAAEAKRRLFGLGD
ncbi:MAG: LytTR family DNA-binding domain-containing protein [Bacteroidales bacterium]